MTRTGTCAGRSPRRSASCRRQHGMILRFVLLKKFGSDPIMVDAVVSSIPGAEEPVLTEVLRSRERRRWRRRRPSRRSRPQSRGAETFPRFRGCSRSSPTRSNPPRFGWRCCRASTRFFPRPGATPVAAAAPQGRVALAGLSTPGAGEAFTPGRPVTLTAEPVELARLGSGAEPLAAVAKSVVNKLDWPNRPVPDRRRARR